MAARTIPDGAGVTNHFVASFAPHVVEGNFTGISGLGDETEVVDGPDGRGYATGKASRKDLSIMIPCHDPACAAMHAWKDLCENGAIGHAVTGTITVMTAGDVPVQVWEVTNAICKSVETTEMKLEGGEVAVDTFGVSIARAKRIGP